jgi:hypothetical protein
MSSELYQNDGSLRVWFRDEIRNALVAAYVASCAAVAHDQSPESVTFRRGFTAALVAVGLNFGITPLPFATEDPQLALRDEAEPCRQIIERGPK